MFYEFRQSRVLPFTKLGESFSYNISHYTKEREALHANLTFDEIVKGSMEMDEKRKNK